MVAASVWDTLVPVIVGGGIAVIGGLIGPPFLHWLQRKTDKQKKRAEKFEELVAAVYEHDHWIDALRNNRVLGYDAVDTVSPFAKIHAISDTYFPEFETAVEELRTVTTAYQMWMLNAGQSRLQNNPALYAGHETAMTPYVEKRQALLTELRSFARREFQ